MLNVVKAVVNEEAQFGDDSQLIAHARAQVVTDGFLVCGDVLDDFLRFF